MQVVRKLAPGDHPWLRSKPLVRLLHILNSEKLNVRLVGGCVRDALLGRDIIDIDLACCLTPDVTMSRLKSADVKVIPTGLKHGTVTAVIEGHSFEITTLRRDVETDGRHAKVAFTGDWAEDARRRDFTFNALYLDEDGSLYDPCDGLKDLDARRVRFIGNADQRIEEDALRILRFFRFAAQIGQGELESSGLKACIRNRNLIDNLSGERLAQELFKTLKADNLLAIIKVMADKDILQKIVPNHRGLDIFNDFVRLEDTIGRCDILARLSCLLVGDGAEASRKLRLSNRQAKTLNQYMTHDIRISYGMSQQEIREMIYRSGRAVFIFALLQYWSSRESDSFTAFLSYAEEWPIPVYPVLGRDVMAAGVAAGPELGQILKKLEALWLGSDFKLSKEDLLAQL